LKRTKKSPIKDKPLRYPGQSIDDQIDDLWDSFTSWFFIAAFQILFILWVWMSYYSEKPQNPAYATILGTLISLVAIWKIYTIKQTINRLRMARDGEKVIGQYLDELRAAGAVTLHDVPGDKFNLDHVIVSPQGVFLIETKTYSKPIKGDARILIKDDQVLANGYVIDRNPLTQSRALARWLADILIASTGKKFQVRPVVVFPGWFVEPMTGKEDVWVLNPKALPKFIENCPITLSPEDQHLIVFHLMRYIRQAQK
jgi:hypothetical protein